MELPAGIRLFVLPKNQVVVHDNWQVAGLKASGSSDYSVEDMFVPEEMTIAFLDTILGRIVTGGAALRLGMPAIVTPFAGLCPEFPKTTRTRTRSPA